MINSKIISSKIEQVLNCLLNLDEYEISSIGTNPFMRDFGMKYFDWPQGVGIYSMNKYHHEQSINKYESYLLSWFTNNYNSNVVKNINTVIPFYTYLDYIDRIPHLEKIVKDWSYWLFNDLPRAGDNIFQHVTSNEAGDGVLLKEGEVWIDTLFMSVLFLNKYGIIKNKTDYCEQSIYQFLKHIEYLFDHNDKLFYHGYSFNNRNNFGGIYWARGNSWFVLASVDLLEMNSMNKGRSDYEYIKSVLNNHVEGLMNHATVDVLFNTVINNPESYIEISGSAGILAGILKGIRLNLIDSIYLKKCYTGLTSILKYIDDNGLVKSVSTGTSIGMNEDHYLNIPCSIMAYGQSLVAVLLIESLNHLDQEGWLNNGKKGFTE